jgi:hypothetical protein
MSNRTFKVALCLMLIALVIACLGCAGRNKGNDQGSTATATPAPAPAASGTPLPTAPGATPAPTAQPGGTGGYTTNLSPDDVIVSDGDMQDSNPEDTLPTPAAE